MISELMHRWNEGCRDPGTWLILALESKEAEDPHTSLHGNTHIEPILCFRWADKVRSKLIWPHKKLIEKLIESLCFPATGIKLDIFEL